MKWASCYCIYRLFYGKLWWFMSNIKPAEHLADIWLLTRDMLLLDLELFPRDIFSTICLCLWQRTLSPCFLIVKHAGSCCVRLTTLISLHPPFLLLVIIQLLRVWWKRSVFPLQMATKKLQLTRRVTGFLKMNRAMGKHWSPWIQKSHHPFQKVADILLPLIFQ